MRNPLPFSVGGSNKLEATNWRTMCEVDLGGGVYYHGWAEVECLATGGSFDEFRMQVKPHEDGAYTTMLTDKDFDDCQHSLQIDTYLGCTDKGPHEIGPGETAAFHFFVCGAAAVRFQGKSVAGGSAHYRIRGRLLAQHGG